MTSVFHIIKIACAVIFGVAGAVALFLALPYALPLFVGSIAFSEMPE